MNDGITVLHAEMEWLGKVIDQVIRSYLLQDGHENRWQDIDMQELSDDEGAYASTIREWNLNTNERLALALAMAPHLKPEVLDIFFGKNQLYDRAFTEFGGVVDANHSGFSPRGQP